MEDRVTNPGGPPNAGEPPRDEDLKVTRADPPRSAAGADDLRTTSDFGPVLGMSGVRPMGESAPTRVINQATLESETVDLASAGGVGPVGRLPEVEGYDIVRRIGHGGMGVVFEALQHATGRRVAIKFMLDGSVNAETLRKRFEREVDVVAALSHPGIVSIIDSGVRKGRYFYVMEFVDGRPLDEAFLPGSCDIRKALLLMTQICDAVDYAHQRGVLHRDLKPSNILIDESGAPHLLDFGLAKRVDDSGRPTTGLTAGAGHGRFGVTIAEPGQLVGTVAYMSPEQSLGHAAEMGVRSDVYALGVIAYELIAGRLPVGMEGSIREVLTRIAEKEPEPSSTFRDGISGDLDAVLLKALEKQPNRRYPTAGEFADDIRRYLGGLPVVARRIGSVGRTWRWVLRNQVLSAVILSAVVTLGVTSTALISRIVEARDRAERELQDARDQNALLTSTFFGADPERADKPIEVTDLLDDAMKLLNSKPPKNELTEASARELIGTVYRKFDQFPKAAENLSKALAIRERHPQDQAELADCLHENGALYWWDGRYDLAEPLYIRSLAIRRTLHKGDHSDTATSLTHLAACKLRMGSVGQAHDLYKQALEMRQRLYNGDHEQVAGALNNLAKSHLDAEEYDDAEELFRDALAMIIRLKGERVTATASALQNLAGLLYEREHYREALEAYQRALAIRVAFYRQEHHFVAATKVGVAQTLLALGNAADAYAEALAAREVYEARGRVNHVEYAECLQVLGVAAVTTEGPARGEAILREAIAAAKAVRQPAPFRMALIKGDLGELLARNGSGEAGTLLKESVDLLRADRGERSRYTRKAAKRYVDYCDAHGQPSAAEGYRKLAAEIATGS